MGPPSSGALTVGQILGILSHFDLAALGPGLPATHLFLEASKLAFADRGLYMADSDFVAMPEGLLDPGYLAGARRADRPRPRRWPRPRPGEPPWKKAELRAPDAERPEHGTTHFVIVDRYGDMLTATTTIETNFGSRVVADGFLLNNELTDFAFAPEADGKPVANRVEPGKRPRSSMAPTVVLQGRQAGAADRLAGRRQHHPLRRPGAGRHPRLRRGPADGDRRAARPEPQRHDPGRGRPRRRGDRRRPRRARPDAAEAVDLNSGLQAILIGDGTLTGAADQRREGLVMGD